MTTATLFLANRVALHFGDCLDVLRTMETNSVDSVVTDPPYHLTSIVKRFDADNAAPCKEGKTGAYARASRGFMGKQWDGGDIAFRPELWAEVLRVLKPGGYVVAFASTRGFGRMSVAIEDAGFTTHPLIAWIFGTGFPKATRITAEGYDGWRYGGQALKPSIEPIYMGQKPFSEATGTANVLRWGTGALNIAGCRVATDDALRAGAGGLWSHGRDGAPPPVAGAPSQIGRWPANVITDGSDEVVSAFPQSDGGHGGGSRLSRSAYRGGGNADGSAPHSFFDTGSAARFFYSAKADADDRVGSKHPTVKPVDLMCWLVRLVTPPGGTVFDPFAGTGTTGEAAWREGFKAILIEREAEYQADIARRMALCLAGPDERARAAIKARLGDLPAGPLFDMLAEAAE